MADGIRTHTVQGLSLLPPTYCATATYEFGTLSRIRTDT